MTKPTNYDYKLSETAHLIPYANNSRTHSEEQVKQIASSMKEFGFTSPVLIDEDGGIIAGHGRVMAAELLELKEVPSIVLAGLTEAQKKAYIIADNQLPLNADWNLDLLKLEIQNLNELDFNIDLLGFDDDFLDGLLELEPEDGLTDEDAVPEAPENPVSVLGDIWQLGNHRLMCGDSTSIDDVERLFDGQKADITFTSPPYNVGATPNGNDKKYLNDNDNKSLGEFRTFLNEYTINALLVSDYVFSNIQSLAGNKISLIEHLYDMREKFADTMIWDKKTAEPAMARKVLNSRFEYIHIFSNDAKRVVGSRDFRGTLSNIVEINSKQDKKFSKIHKATFPMEFADHFISNFSESSVYEPFCGTGTVLICCEKNNRNCFAIELDPRYVDVIIKRWEEFTGKQAIHVESGKTYNELNDGGSTTTITLQSPKDKK